MRAVPGERSLFYRVGVLLAAMILGLLLFLFEDWGWQSSAELRAYDMLLRMRFARTPASDIAVLGIGKETIDKVGGLPLDQSVHAKIINALNRADAKLIVYDTAIPQGGAALRAAIEKRHNVLLPITYDPARPPSWGSSSLRALVRMERYCISDRIRFSPETLTYAYYDFLPPPSEFGLAARDCGVVVGSPATSGIVRSAGLAYMTTVKYPVPSRALPPTFPLPALTDSVVAVQGLPLAASMDVLGVRDRSVDVDYSGSISLLSQGFPVVRIPTDVSGGMLINYAGPSGSFSHFSAENLLGGTLPAGTLSGKIVVVGVVDPASSEGLISTPYSEMPRAEVTANAIATIIKRAFIVRSETEALILMFFLALVVGLVFPGIGLRYLGVWALSVAMGYIVLAMIVLSVFGHAWPVISPVILIALTAAASALLHPAMFYPAEDYR